MIFQVKFESIFVPRYFTFSVRYSLSPHNFIFKPPSNFFCLDLKITILAFFAICEIFIAFSQLTRCFRSALTSLLSFFIALMRLRHNRLVSSVKWGTLQNVIARLRSFIDNKNIRGPITDS